MRREHETSSVSSWDLSPFLLNHTEHTHSLTDHDNEYIQLAPPFSHIHQLGHLHFLRENNHDASETPAHQQ